MKHSRTNGVTVLGVLSLIIGAAGWGCFKIHEERNAIRNLGQNMMCTMTAAVLALMPGIAGQAVARPLKVFILAGQSNMQGHVIHQH
jgi:hypothetical protein